MNRQLQELIPVLEKLNPSQFEWVARMAQVLAAPKTISVNPKSDFMTAAMADSFGIALLLHHAMSKEPFSKDKFEYVLERVCMESGVPAELAPKGNPGHDITIRGVAVSLKTQADAAIKDDEILVSKWMELGKGEWSNQPEQLRGLAAKFARHMKSYERIFTLRCLAKGPAWRYELVELPKSWLRRAPKGEFEMKVESRQNPKPGYCTVRDAKRNVQVLQLYFDGGTERKLQLRIRKDYCTVHAAWTLG